MGFQCNLTRLLFLYLVIGAFSSFTPLQEVSFDFLDASNDSDIEDVHHYLGYVLNKKNQIFRVKIPNLGIWQFRAQNEDEEKVFQQLNNGEPIFIRMIDNKLVGFQYIQVHSENRIHFVQDHIVTHQLQDGEENSVSAEEKENLWKG